YDQAIQQLYVAYFNRPADPAGLNYWNTVVAANKGSTTAVSAAFAGSAEYKAAYAGLNSTQIVDRVYQNLFGRAAEPSGLAYWALALDQKNTTIDNVVTIIATAAQGTDATAYKNKVTAATSFTTALDTNAEIVGYTGDAALGIAKTYISSVTDDASLAKAIATDALNQTVFAATAGALTVGTLTNGVDNLVAHTFNAPQVYTPGGNNFINSLQNDDKLTGTDASDDVLNVTLGNPNDNGQAEILPTLSKIETINAKFDATSQSMVLDLQDSTGVKAINITRIADGKNATVKNITEATTNTLSVANTQSPAGTVTFNYLTSAVAGATDTVNVTASNINVANLTVQSADGTKGFETFNLTSTGSANTIKQLTAQDIQTLKISGDTNLTLGAASNTTGGVNNQPEATRYAAGLDNVAGSLKAVDASALKGALDITIGTEINAGLDNTSGVNINETITGGSGNDIFRLATGASIDAADSIIGGAATGTDTNTLVLLGNNTVAGTVSKVQALEIRTGHDAGAVADVVNVDASKIVDLATTYIRNEGQQNTGTWTSAAEGATVNLTKLTAAQDTAITIA
ncbi:DUF4214 domain-containing protein, partial [Undibacterium sp. SXout7W]|uniref:DUF4214 domain-containing protein n=1 Tax=Undibacterium sp. SXout7W TaxID=3413049 RepID=UPI003BF08415